MATQTTTIKVVAETPECEPQAHELAKRLNLDSSLVAADESITLFVTTDGLFLANNIDGESRVHIDFTTGKNAHRRIFGGGLNQTIARATGLNKNKNQTIIDATGGFARDAFVLASLGAKLIILEQSPILCLLIEDALLKGADDSDVSAIMQRMSIHNCNSVDALQSTEFQKTADVVYMDPMYPGRQKNAAVKKDMQLLHTMIGADKTAEELLNAAMYAAKKRVVVKRPVKADAISSKRLAGAVSSKNTRYDIYTPFETEAI